MIYVEYDYFKKSDGKWHQGVTMFDSPKKASRFIRSMTSKKGMFYTGFTSDDSEECEEMNRLI